MALGLFAAGEMPWSVFINDLRIIAETVRYPAEFFHYLEWRSRLPLGERVTAVEELDLFGSFLLREQIQEILSDGKSSLHLQSGVDFDSYYLSEQGDGPPAERPRMFSIPLIDRYLERLSRQRPPGWVGATGVVLDLSLQQLAALDVATPRLLQSVEPTGVDVVAFGSLALVAVGLRRRWQEAYTSLQSDLTEYRSLIFLSVDYASQPMILWSMHP
jgi:hypothetical protein